MRTVFFFSLTLCFVDVRHRHMLDIIIVNFFFSCILCWFRDIDQSKKEIKEEQDFYFISIADTFRLLHGPYVKLVYLKTRDRTICRCFVASLFFSFLWFFFSSILCMMDAFEVTWVKMHSWFWLLIIVGTCMPSQSFVCLF